MKVNLTNELSNLLFFTGETATAIRMYSCYAKSHTQFTEQDSLDVMFLSDTLHYFSDVHHEIIACTETGRYSPLVSACKRIIGIYEDFQNMANTNTARSELARLALANPNNARLVDLSLAIGSLKAIIEKCEFEIIK